MKRAIKEISVTVSKTIQETRYEPWHLSVTAAVDVAGTRQTNALGIAAELRNELTRFVDESCEERLEEDDK